MLASSKAVTRKRKATTIVATASTHDEIFKTKDALCESTWQGMQIHHLAVEVMNIIESTLTTSRNLHSMPETPLRHGFRESLH